MRPSLTVLPPGKQQYDPSPIMDQYNEALVSAATSLQTALNDLLRSPVSSTSAFSRSTSVQKPLPSHPRSASVSSIAELPAELPGSLLLANQGFPSCTTPIPVRPITHICRRESHPPDKCLDYETVSLDALNIFSAPLIHTRSVPELRSRYSTMRHIRSSNVFNHGAAATATPLDMEEKTSLNKAGLPSRSRPHLGTPLSLSGDQDSMTREGGRCDGLTWTSGRAHAQPAPLVEEKIFIDRDFDRSQGYRVEVSVVCFVVDVCLLDKQDRITKQFQNFCIHHLQL